MAKKLDIMLHRRIRRAVDRLERELKHECHADIRGLINPVLAGVTQDKRRRKSR